MEDKKPMVNPHPEAVFRIRGNKVYWGPGLRELLERVERTRSVKAAAQEMFMSYSKARRLIALAEEELGFALVEPRKGGNVRGQTTLTEQGERYLRKCQQIQQEVQAYCEERYREYFGE